MGKTTQTYAGASILWAVALFTVAAPAQQDTGLTNRAFPALQLSANARGAAVIPSLGNGLPMAARHEVGHRVGLYHDGVKGGSNFCGGHGSGEEGGSHQDPNGLQGLVSLPGRVCTPSGVVCSNETSVSV